MAAPNIVNVATITGKSNVANVTNAFSNLVVNSASSGKVFKLNTLYITNVTSSGSPATGNISITLTRSGYDYGIANGMPVPANTSLDIISKSLYLEEGDYVRVKADSDNRLHAVCSYEELS